MKCNLLSREHNQFSMTLQCKSRFDKTLRLKKLKVKFCNSPEYLRISINIKSTLQCKETLTFANSASLDTSTPNLTKKKLKKDILSAKVLNQLISHSIK